ncbi:zinc finger protein 28 [Culex quinquefasciatus]|uniref:zinc finger protein 28 n=1 Tax=Culex quinquefasciatus TaxID=7176 RepID=UPI0018E3ED49|nr:zinc finger protein 28 [Culex quinquefasciatus]
MRNCSRRSARHVVPEDDAQEAVETIASKRPYKRKSMQCRLCLRVLSKAELPEIFAEGNSVQKAIKSAVSVEVSRKDRSIRICQCCLNLVHIINDFREVCARTEQLLLQEVEISGDSFWTQELDQEAIGTCHSLVEDCRREIDRLLPEESPVKSEARPEEDDTLEEPDQIELKLESLDEVPVLMKPELCGELNFEDVQLEILDLEEKSCEIEDENETFDKEQQPEEKVIRKRRGRPPLPEELRKHRKRNPDEPKKKRGPKLNRNKLPAQSVCEICGMLVNRENQERHRNEHLGHRPYACSVEGCEHSFSSRAGLLGHMARHADRNNVYDCDICGAKIKTKSSLQRHRKMHTAEKPHACSICGKRFWRKSYLNHHATVHTGIAKFPCEYCGFVFKNKYWRSFHVKQKHVAKGDQPKYEAHEELDENGEMMLPEGLVEEGEEDEGEVEYMEVVCE